MTEEIQQRFDASHEKLTSILADFINGGYADTFAKLLVYMGEKKVEETISNLSEPMKTKVLDSYKNYSSKKITDPEIISAAGYVLKQKGFYGKEMSKAVSENLDTIQLSELSKQTDELFKQDPLIALNLEQNLFVFENLTELDDRSIQKFFREIDTQELAKALHGADEEIQNKIFSNMSKRAAAMLKEDMEFMGPVRMVDVIEARKNIIDIILRLEANGEIVIRCHDILI